MAVSAQEPSTDRKPHRSRRTVFLCNAQAGGLLGGDMNADALADALREGGEVSVVPADAGTLPERMAIAKNIDAECIVVAGGDGTVACAAEALLGGDAILGIIPCGTMNLLARDLGLDPADPRATIASILSGGTRRIDAGTVNGHVFLCASMLGTPARLGRVREMGRRHGNGPRAWANLLVAGLRALGRNRSLRLRLSTEDGRVLDLRTPSVTITVNRLADQSGRLFGRDTLDGGELGIYVVRRAGALRQAATLLRALLTGTLRAPDIDFLSARAVTVEAKTAAMHVLLDGELRLIAPPLRYEIKPQALLLAGRQ